MCSGLCFSDFSDKHLCKEVPGICVELYSDVYGRRFIVGIHDASGQVHFQVAAKGWWSVLYLGIISTTVAIFFRQHARSMWMETKAAIILSMESVFEPCSRL